MTNDEYLVESGALTDTAAFNAVCDELVNAHTEIERLRAAVIAARRGGVEAAIAVASQRATSRHSEVMHCVSDRSKKHMQIRADEAGQLVADLRALGENSHD